MGTLESAQGFWTNTGSVGIPPHAASLGTDDGTKIHCNSKIIELIHGVGGKGRIFGLGVFCGCLGLIFFFLKV